MRRLAAIMFSDIAGYSAMMSKDEKNAMNILEKNRGIHKSLITRYNGQYIKEIGDGTLAIFQSGLDAVFCAIKIRNACAKEQGLSIRIGIHIGDIVLQDGDVFGDSVNIASRIESAGEPGGIFISEKVYDDLRNKEGISAEFYGEKNLKNIPDPVKIYRITTGDTDNETPVDYGYHDRQKSEKTLSRKKYIALSLFAVLAATIIFALYLLKPGIFTKDQLKDVRSADGRISVAVLPFYNMTNDSTWNVWQEGIQDMLISSLSNSEGLQVRQFESVNNILRDKGILSYASMTPGLAGTISEKLDAGVFVFGNFKKAGPSLRVSAQLIDSKTQQVFKSFQIEGDAKEESIFPIIDSLTGMVNDFLVISRLKNELTPDYQRIVSTKSPDAYRYFILGKNAFNELDFRHAIEFLSKAAEIDTSFSMSYFLLSIACLNVRNYEDAKKYCLMIYNRKEKEPPAMKIMINTLYALNFESPREENVYLKQLLEIDDQNPMFRYQLGNNYLIMEQYDKAIPQFEKALDIYKSWEIKPDWILHYLGLIHSYFKTGNYDKMKECMIKAKQDFPDEISSHNYYDILYSLAINDTLKANEYLAQRLGFFRENGIPEHIIAFRTGNIYSQAMLYDKAESYYRKAYSLKPDDPEMINTLGYFLIDTERNIDEGVALLSRAVEMKPDEYLYLDSKGWGLYKQGKTAEALALIEKSNDLSPIYNHEIFLHLQEVRKTASNAK